MINCEESSCDNFQSVICLHCMRRLCVYHIQVHHRILLNKTDELKNDASQVSTLLVDASNAIIEERTMEERKCISWRLEQIANIEREYNQHINAIENRQKILEELHAELNQRLKVEVEQPLEHMLSQESTNPQLLDDIQSTIEHIRKDSELLRWTSELKDTVHQSSMHEKSKPKTKPSIISKETKVKAWKPRNYMFTLFRDVGPNSFRKINEWVQTIMKDENAIEKYGLITLVFSYLRTWYQTKADRGKHKQLILNKHILTVKYYVTGRDCQRKVLIALQFFFHSLKLEESLAIEMMTMLLQLFFDHQCISIPEMIDWYSSDTFADEIMKTKIDKKWVEPFLIRHGYQIESKDLTSESSENPQKDSDQSTSKICEQVRIRKPFRNLVKLFRDQSNINDLSIHQYIQIQYRKNTVHRVIMVVRSYLKAWNEFSSEMTSDYLLNKVPIIQYYKSDHNFEMQILFAIELFLFQCKKDDKWSIETISTLFQFFLNQHCLTKETILRWNSDGHFYNELYYEKTRGFAQSFIQQLLTSD